MGKIIPVQVLGTAPYPPGPRLSPGSGGEALGEGTTLSEPEAPAELPAVGKKQVELSTIHDFASKLKDPFILPRLKEYVRWHAALRASGAMAVGPGGDAGSSGEIPPVPDYAPVSINLDITTACNYACDHCVDMDILNTGIKYNHEKLLDSIAVMAGKGLRSVIVIGGGEPTVYPKFSEAVRFMKALGLQVSVVTNGSGMKKIAEVADVLEASDWVRLSLDSSSDDIFQKMHKPRRPITLDQICEGVAQVRAMKPRFKLGFSFIITWKGATINETNIVENLHEIVPAAERARKYGFDYISYKPFLTRAPENNAEIVDLEETDASFDAIMNRIRAEVDEAKKLATPAFSVYEATNLKVLENRSYKNYTHQPHTCHMQFFRQVLSPLGMYNCPVYRNQPHGRLGEKDAYADLPSYEETRRSTAKLIASFDATSECREVTCLYNHVNWWIEDLIEHPEKIESIEPTPPGAGPADYFL